MTMSVDDVVSILGPTDRTVINDVIGTGASVEELVEAWGWISNDEAMVNEGRHLPSGRVAELIDLLSSPEAEP